MTTGNLSNVLPVYVSLCVLQLGNFEVMMNNYD